MLKKGNESKYINTSQLTVDKHVYIYAYIYVCIFVLACLFSKKSLTGPRERTPKPEYLIALAAYLGVSW